MNLHKKFFAHSAIPLLLCCLITGCITEDHLSTTILEQPEIEKATPVPSPTASPLLIDHTQTAQNDKEDLIISSAEDDVTEIPTDEPYDANHPTLMGFTIHDSLASVTQRFGEPANKYNLEDEQDTLTVYEYPGFDIGFTALKQIKFINVNSKDMDPGLNGLRLGQTVSNALKALGNPNNITAFVLSYLSNGVVLKLDVDPQTDSINSIKLFEL